MLGQGLSGISLNFIRMLMLAIFPPGNEDSGSKSEFIGCLVYFSLAAVVVLI